MMVGPMMVGERSWYAIATWRFKDLDKGGSTLLGGTESVRVRGRRLAYMYDSL